MTISSNNLEKRPQAKTPTIGVAGITIPGALDCINKIHKKSHYYFGAHDHPNIILHQLNFGPTHRAQHESHWDVVESRVVRAIASLEKAGADFAIIPANTVHKVIDGIQKKSRIPVINMLEIVAEQCQQRHFKKVGVLGTSWTMREHLYQEPLRNQGIQEVIPSIENQVIVQQIIFSELIPTGKVKPESLKALLGVVNDLKNQHCDAIALACTELPLVLNDENCEVVTLDTTDILAGAAMNKAISFTLRQ